MHLSLGSPKKMCTIPYVTNALEMAAERAALFLKLELLERSSPNFCVHEKMSHSEAFWVGQIVSGADSSKIDVPEGIEWWEDLLSFYRGETDNASATFGIPLSSSHVLFGVDNTSMEFMGIERETFPPFFSVDGLLLAAFSYGHRCGIRYFLVLFDAFDMSLIPRLSLSTSTPEIARLVARPEFIIPKEPELSRPVFGRQMRVIEAMAGLASGPSSKREDVGSGEELSISGRLRSDMGESDTPHEREERE